MKIGILKYINAYSITKHENKIVKKPYPYKKNRTCKSVDYWNTLYTAIKQSADGFVSYHFNTDV